LTVQTIQAQDCTQLVNKVYDEVTGTTLIRMKDYLFISEDTIKKVAIFVAQKIDDQGIETSLTLDCRDLGCISNGNAINLLFTDGSREQYTNMSAFNCVGFAILFIDIPDYKGNIIRSTLMNKKIKTLRVSGNNKFMQVNLTTENQDHLISVLKCLR
jgi:hypothetical protein